MKCDQVTDGRLCRANAMRGTHKCIMHSGRASELGRRGGRRRAVTKPVGLKKIPPPRTAGDVRALISLLIVEMRNGAIHTQLASALVGAAGLLLKTIAATDFEARLQKLESYHKSRT